MTPVPLSYEPQRNRALVVADARLTKVLQREPESCASVNEYSQRTGIDAGQVLELFSPAIDAEILCYDIFGGEFFVNTCPLGRSQPQQVEVLANLWERLRSHGDTSHAFQLWRLMRSLERAGWRVEANPNRLMFSLSAMAYPPSLGLHVGHTMVPVLVHPSAEQVMHPEGFLTMFDRAGAGSVAVVCDSGELDTVVTAARMWRRALSGNTVMGVLVLEAPSFAPTVLYPGDASVAPRSVSVSSLQNDTALRPPMR